MTLVERDAAVSVSSGMLTVPDAKLVALPPPLAIDSHVPGDQPNKYPLERTVPSLRNTDGHTDLVMVPLYAPCATAAIADTEKQTAANTNFLFTVDSSSV
jgi:hypothetical protein